MTGSHSLQITVKQAGWLSSCFLVGLGCSAATTAPSVAGPAGIWERVSENGVTFPALLVSARYNQRIAGEHILLRTNHTYAKY